ncbi:hypothetical protein [Microbacterium yannicii]|uniref:hypothetical protein n=1 Tax=Microbacterium yannicii TaxID=671622 RepID=UPI0002E062CE|nr:hypothetical protein [Microbacterium yannicii]
MDEYWVAVVWTLLPTIVVSAIFFFVLRSIIRSDRTERRVYARIEAKERAKRGLPPVATAVQTPAPQAVTGTQGRAAASESPSSASEL